MRRVRPVLCRSLLICLSNSAPEKDKNAATAQSAAAGNETRNSAANDSNESAARLPVRRVVLYKNGVGFFEHSGRVTGDQSVTIDFTTGQLNSLSNLSRWAFLPAFAGVGLRTNLRDLLGQGWRPLAVGILGEIFIALVTLALVYWSYNHGVTR